MEKIIFKNEIKPTGSYFEVDLDGYLVNPTSFEKIQTEWKPLIDDVVSIYKDVFGNSLKQVYIRGSVAKGEAIEGVSDLDTFAYVDRSVDFIKENNIERSVINKLEDAYRFVESVEIDVIPTVEIPNDYIILNQALCVYGEPVDVPKMKPGKEMVMQAYSFCEKFSWFEGFMEDEGNSSGEIKKGCVWLMKLLLRVGFELTMEREKKYTRDLYRCYETFVKYYPEKKYEMYEVLNLALNPVSEKSVIKKVMSELGSWMLIEVSNNLEVNVKD